MNVYEFYLSTCKYVMLADSANKSTWSDLYGYLPCLRQMLSCCVCGHIMLRPKGPSHGICAHHVCASCIGGKMRLRPACSWCRTHEGFVENRGLRFIVLCFAKMCRYINSSAIGQEIRKAATNGAHTNTLIRVLDEAAAFDDDYVISNKVMPACVPAWGMAPEPKLVSVPRGHSASKPSTSGCAGGGNRGRSDSAAYLQSLTDTEAASKMPSASTNKPVTTTNAPEKEKAAVASMPLKLAKLSEEFERMPALLAPCTRGILSQEKLSPPLPSTRADVHDHDESQNNWIAQDSKKHRGSKVQKALSEKVTIGSDSNMTKKLFKKSVVQQKKVFKIKGKYKNKQKAYKHEIDFEPPCKRTRLASSLNVHGGITPQRKICRCARLNAPSRLTCFGQRCPCYSSRLPCISCMCRGCRNPRKETELLRSADEDKSDCEHDPPMPRLSPEPRT